MRMDITVEQLDRVEKLLYGISKGAETAKTHAFNRGIQAGKTEANRQIRQRYAISAATVNANQRVTLKKSSGGGNAEVEFAGPKIALYKYRPSPSVRTYKSDRIPVPVRFEGGNPVWRLVYRNAPVSAMDSKASGMIRRESAFIATFASGHTGIFRRTKAITDTGQPKLKEYWGYSVADMLDYEPAKEAVAKRITEVVDQRLEHEIGRILSRY